MLLLFFLFKKRTAYELRISDWSSDVCSSDLTAFDAPHLAVSPETATGEPVAGTIKLSSKQNVLGLALGMTGLGGNATNLTLKELKIDGGLKEGDRLVQLKMTSPANWNALDEKGGLSAMKGDVRIADSALPGGSFEFPFIGSLQARQAGR